MNLREEIKDKIPAYFIPLCHTCCLNIQLCGLPLWLSSKESACNARDAGGAGSVPGSGKSPREVLGNPLQYSPLENPMDREDCESPVHGSHSWTLLKQLSMHTHIPQCARYHDRCWKWTKIPHRGHSLLRFDGQQ